MSLWQSSTWSNMLLQTHQIEKSFQIGNISVQKRSVGLGKYGIFVMGVKTYTKTEQDSLIELCKKEQCLFVQVETLNYEESTDIPLSHSFKKGYYKKFITPYTAIINLELTEDEILAKMKPKGRYNIKLARKKGITVRKVEKTEENIKSYYTLSSETTKRDNFSGHSLKYYKSFLEDLNNSELYLAYKDEEVIAGGIFVFDSEVSYYYYGASSSKKEFRNLMAPYLLQWEAISHAKKIDSKIYDFLGISGEGEYFDASLSGVTDFKMKLTPNALKVSDSYIWINKKISYNFLLLLRSIKKRL